MFGKSKGCNEVFNLTCCKIFYYSSMGKNQKNKPQSAVARKFMNLMLSLDECKKILKNNNTDEVKMIREYLYLLANLQIESENNSLNVDSL